MFDNFPFWPERASTAAGNVDALFIFLLIVSGLMTALIFTAVVYFAARYRRRKASSPNRSKAPRRSNSPGRSSLSFVFMVIFVWGAVVYFKGRTPPRDSTEVYVVAKQWMWKLEHAEGQREINELHVPVGRDVKLIMTSQDVIHSFFVPAFRMKQDVLPGRYTVAWFRATKPGTYHLFCAEYCGTQHSGMIGSIVVMDPAAVRSLDERRHHRPALRHRRKNLRRTRLRPPAIAPTHKAAARTCRESSASPCNSKTDAPSPPTKITFANPSSIPAPRASKDSSPSCPRSRDWSVKSK